MSDSTFMVLGALELVGLVGLFALVKVGAKRKKEGKGRLPRAVRISAALVGLVLIVGFPVLMIMKITNPTREIEARQAELIAKGTEATATITDLKETGTMVNKRPQVRVSLTVEPKDEPAFPSQWTWVFSVKDTQNYKVGAKVKVFYDPADRKTVAVAGLAE